MVLTHSCCPGEALIRGVQVRAVTARGRLSLVDPGVGDWGRTVHPTVYETLALHAALRFATKALSTA